MPKSEPGKGERKIPFGLRDGQMVHVEAVAPGKGCGCVCAECGQPLVASNRLPRVVAKYFRHDSKTECPGGYESAIHRAAKEVLLRLRRVTLPGRRESVRVTALDGKVFEQVVEVSARGVSADQAWEELWQEGMRPDVVFEVGGRTLYLEILVSHAVDLVKQQQIRDRKIAALEIDLSDLSPEDLVDMAGFERRVCDSLASRDWLHFPKFEERLQGVQAELVQRKEAHELKLAQESERRRQAAEEEARLAPQKAALAAQRQKVLRQKHTSVLACIEGFQDPSLIEEMDRRRQDVILYEPLQGQFAPDMAFLFKRTEGFWIFEARYQDWQAFVLDLILPPTPPRPITTLKALGKAVAQQFGVVPWVEKVNRFERARRFAPDSDDGLVLYTTEVGAIPDPYAAVSRYVEHLASLGMVDRRLRPSPGKGTDSLHEALLALLAREKEKQTQTELVELAAKLRRGRWNP